MMDSATTMWEDESISLSHSTQIIRLPDDIHYQYYY